MPEMNELEEVRTMLAETAEGWTREWERNGEVKILTRLLQRRFGDLPAWVSEKIAKAEPSFLEKWADRVLDTQTLDAVFAEPV
ncbi:MAG: DUF4351 domain-containing protein [Magnetococcus sp. YQC-5]